MSEKKISVGFDTNMTINEASVILLEAIDKAIAKGAYDKNDLIAILAAIQVVQTPQPVGEVSTLSDGDIPPPPPSKPPVS